MSTLKIEADPDLKDLLPEYIEKRKKELAEMQTAVAGGSLDIIEKHAHSTKGHAAGYGFDGLGEICENLDQAAADGDIDKVKAMLNEYDSYINNVEIV